MRDSNALNIEVTLFARTMLYKLHLNDHKGGWEHDTAESLLEYLKAEVEELEEAIRSGNLVNVMDEAADVGNFAMMIHSNAHRQIIDSLGKGGTT